MRTHSLLCDLSPLLSYKRSRYRFFSPSTPYRFSARLFPARLPPILLNTVLALGWLLHRVGTLQFVALSFVYCPPTLAVSHIYVHAYQPTYIHTQTLLARFGLSPPNLRSENSIMSSSGSVSVAAQAELMEKEKTVTEHQQRLESLRHTIKTMATRQVTLKRTERRCQITVGELTKLKPEHVVYQGIGRAFMRTPVNRLIGLNNEEIERCEAEESRLSNEKLRTSELVTKEEGELRRAVEEFRAALMVAQAAQSRTQRSE
ncbi:hypothetical protein LSCM1_03707 [Leishmania martiniquensis]|uniref:Prefoldin subunit n=1 Tax=Leishmania martiniquensis TaxID=1580590 RepID=A0A836GZ19_9TRYP|nr:hypothetical protein LSCM1_03707 [Leishmania martiniquensis]